MAVLRDGALPSDVIAASGVIEQAGFTTCDDLLHGYGGGYLPPVLGSAGPPARAGPGGPVRGRLAGGGQPQRGARDPPAGVQTGELVLITADGVERLHAMPRGFFRTGS